jgi:hypothetical protein
MSQLTDGTTTITLTGVQADDFQNTEQSSRRTAGGGIRTIRTGRRFITKEKYRLKGTEYKSFMDLITNNSTEYLFTPTVIPDYMNTSDFPMSVNITIPRKIRQAGGGDKKYHIEVTYEGVDYI